MRVTHARASDAGVSGQPGSAAPRSASHCDGLGARFPKRSGGAKSGLTHGDPLVMEPPVRTGGIAASSVAYSAPARGSRHCAKKKTQRSHPSIGRVESPCGLDGGCPAG